MYCRTGCRCEQQYRLHKLLAFDPSNECRGIFRYVLLFNVVCKINFEDFSALCNPSLTIVIDTHVCYRRWAVVRPHGEPLRMEGEWSGFIWQRCFQVQQKCICVSVSSGLTWLTQAAVMAIHWWPGSPQARMLIVWWCVWYRPLGNIEMLPIGGRGSLFSPSHEGLSWLPAFRWNVKSLVGLCQEQWP